MAKFAVLNDDDLRILREMVNDRRGKRVNPQVRSAVDMEDWLSPETYLAKPQEPIEALAGDKPGYALCDIYVINKEGTELVKTGITKPVFNVSGGAISGYIPVTRDKFGRWIALVGGSIGTFMAVVYERIEIEINEGSDSDPDPCPATMLPRYRGEYSAMEVVEDPHDAGTWRVLDGGRWMKAGTCSALRDINRANHAIEVENKVVRVWEGGSMECGESSGEQASSSDIEVDGHVATGLEPSRVYYWMDLGAPREECTPNRYFITISPDNDTPYV